MTYMEDLWRFGVGLLIFWLVLFLLGKVLPLKRYGVKVEPAYITYRSSKFKAFLYRVSDKRRIFWKTLSNLSIVLGIALTIYAVFFLLDNLFKLFQPGAQGASVVPVLPGLTIRLYWLPYMLLAVFLAVMVHEAAHGIIARVEKISLDSAAVAFVLIFFGGFVELNEEEFEKSPTVSKLRVVSAGSFTNLVMFLLVMLTMLVLFLDVPSGIVITDVSEGSPVDVAGLGRWDVIYDVNGTLRGIFGLLANATAGNTLILNTSKGVQEIVVGGSTTGDAIGILLPYLTYYRSRLGLGPFLEVQLFLTLFWGQIVNSSVAILNMLPLFPFDGDKLLYCLIERLAGKRSREVRILSNALSFGIIAGNMVLSLIKHGSFLI